MLAEIYMLRLEAAARATATAATSSRFVPITLPALPHQTSTCVSPTSKPGMTPHNFFGLAGKPEQSTASGHR